jgi:hypothetical protein
MLKGKREEFLFQPLLQDSNMCEDNERQKGAAT